MTSRIAQVAIDAARPAALAEFWCEVLGWRVLEVDGDVVSIGPEGNGFCLLPRTVQEVRAAPIP